MDHWRGPTGGCFQSALMYESLGLPHLLLGQIVVSVQSDI